MSCISIIKEGVESLQLVLEIEVIRMLELKIGDFEKNSQVLDTKIGIWRFILSKQDETILLYAAEVPLEESFGHRHVVAKYDLPYSSILGGGDIRYVFGNLSIEGYSGDFGIVPNSIMEQFAKKIIEEHKDYPLKSIEIDMFYDKEICEENSQEQIAMWKRLGFDFDDKKREIMP